MMATMTSGSTPVSRPMRSISSACSRQNAAPAAMRSGVRKIARYSCQGFTFSAGRLMASRMGCWVSAASSVRSISARSKPWRSATSSMKRATSAREVSSARAGEAASPATAARAENRMRERITGRISRPAFPGSVRTSVVDLPRQELAMSVDGHEDTETRHERHHGGTAEADQRERYADHRDEAADHGRIHEHVDEEGQADAAGQEPGERVLGVGGDIQSARDDEQVHREQCQHAEQPEFL